MGRLRYIRLTRRQRVRVWTAVVLITVTGLLTAILLHLRPMLVNLATARCSNTVSRIVGAAVNDAVEQGWMEPGKVSKRSMGAHIVCLPNAVDVQLFASGADAPDA